MRPEPIDKPQQRAEDARPRSDGSRPALDTPQATQTPMALERHYSAQEVADMWGLGVDSVRRLFSQEPGVLVLAPAARKCRRRYTTLRIPQSVLERVHRRLQVG